MSANWAYAPTELSLRVPNWAANYYRSIRVLCALGVTNVTLTSGERRAVIPPRCDR
jgi:hypothetical protein